MSRHQLHRFAGAFLVAVTLSACTATQARQSTSVVGYLYPDRQTTIDTGSIPVLQLPLRVGIAFVPPATHTTRYGGTTLLPDEGIPESERYRLMKQVTEHFRKQAMIKSVEVIPTSYLTPGGGFANLDQLRSMFRIDVMVLLAYDQVQFTDEGMASLTYWTLLGAYVVQGEKNDTRTLMDAAVVDIASRRVLFRAPGTSTIKAHATPVELEREQREDRLEGFELASRDLVRNLDTELTRFKERVREAPEEVKVVRSAEFDRRVVAAGGTGAGAMDRSALQLAGVVALLAMLAGGVPVRRRHR